VARRRGVARGAPGRPSGPGRRRRSSTTSSDPWSRFATRTSRCPRAGCSASS
jgi:hypothetical protein